MVEIERHMVGCIPPESGRILVLSRTAMAVDHNESTQQILVIVDSTDYDSYNNL